LSDPIRDANRLRRLERTGARAVASKPRTRAASELRPAANKRCPPERGYRGRCVRQTFVGNDGAGAKRPFEMQAYE